MGKMDIAHEMIKIAAQFCKVHVVKFQKRTNRELLTPEEYNAPHPNPANSYGLTYGEHREYLDIPTRLRICAGPMITEAVEQMAKRR